MVGVDDLWGNKNTHQGPHQYGSKHENEDLLDHDTARRQSSSVEFFRTKGYEVVFSDPESNRYDEESGEVIGQIQCRRDVMRKCCEV